MLFSYNWLQSFFQNKLPTPKKLAEILTLHSFEVEGIKKIGNDFIFDLDITPNRAADCFSHLGIARECVALTSVKLKAQNVRIEEDKKTNIKDFIHLKNGVLKIQANKTINLVNFSPGFCSRNQAPIEFNPEAKCERFLNELLCPAVSEEDAVLVQKYAGLCILGENLIQRFMILGGEAGRGKSQLSLILQELVGLQNVTEIRTHHLRERFELYRYIKKRFW